MKKPVLYVVLAVLAALISWYLRQTPDMNNFPSIIKVNRPPVANTQTGAMLSGDVVTGAVVTGSLVTGSLVVSGDVATGGDGAEPFDPSATTDPEVEEIINILEELIEEAEAEQQ